MKKIIALTFTLFIASAVMTQAESVYRHVVLFKFKDDAPTEKVDAIVKAFGELKNQIPTIIDYEWGPNVSPEGLDDGFTHCFFVSFKDKAGLDVYLPHSAHKEFVEMLKPQLDKVLVVDYVTPR